MRGKKILLISRYDYAGSGYRIAEAISLYTNNFVEYVVLFPTTQSFNFLQYPALSFEYKGKSIVLSQQEDRLKNIVENVDIVHHKGDFLPTDSFYDKLGLQSKPNIITVSGSFFRIGDKNKNISKGKGNFEDFKKLSKLRTALTPDLNYPEFDSIFTQAPYDVEKTEYTWKDNNIPIISHSPSTRNKKGTDVFIEACSQLKNKYKFEVNIIENKSFSECLEEKAKSTFFFDQTLVGSYGNSAIEAMAFGIPTLCNMSKESISQANNKLDDCPIINCGDTVESIKKSIIYALSIDRKKLSEKTRNWCMNIHSYKKVAKMWHNIYNSI